MFYAEIYVPYRSANLPSLNRLNAFPKSVHWASNVMNFDRFVGLHFGMWYIKGITVDNKPLKKYKDVLAKHSVQILPIDIEEFHKIGPDNCFPEALLQDGA